MDKLVGDKLAMECALLCPELVGNVIEFLNLSMIWMMRCMVGNMYDGMWGNICRGDVPA